MPSKVVLVRRLAVMALLSAGMLAAPPGVLGLVSYNDQGLHPMPLAALIVQLASHSKRRGTPK